jgi:hypothetical protein
MKILIACYPEVNVYSNRDKLSSALAAQDARLGAGSAARRNRFCVALSGGSLMDIIGPPLGTARKSSGGRKPERHNCQPAGALGVASPHR